MKKRISKSELRRQVKKKKEKSRRKLSKAEAFAAQLDSLPRRKSPILAFLLTGVTFFNIFPVYGLMPLSPSFQGKIMELIPISSSLIPATAEAEAPKTLTPEEQAELDRIEALRTDVNAIIKGTPMEKMEAYIAKRDRKVAAFLVGIAMKESKFGIYSPKKNKTDCFNYWGYRGHENPTKSGYSCFDSPEQAIQVVGDRIEEIMGQGVKTPAGMVVWKCGWSCDAFDDDDVNKWISDVGINYYRLTKKTVAERK